MRIKNISINPIKFRYSGAKYTVDKSNHALYKGCESIKFMNAEVSDQLYSLRDQQFDSFLDLLNVFPGNSRQREILIKLGYFEEFGGTLKLLKMCDFYDSLHGKKLIKKDKTILPSELLQKYAISETEKQYKFNPESMDALLRELETMLQDEDIPLNERLQAELEYLGYISYTNPELTNTGLVLNVDTKYSPKISMYLLDKGETVTYKLQKSAYQKNPFDKGQILRFYAEERNKSKKTENGWEKLPDKE